MLMWKLAEHEGIQKGSKWENSLPFMVIIRASTDLGYFFSLGHAVLGHVV